MQVKNKQKADLRGTNLHDRTNQTKKQATNLLTTTGKQAQTPMTNHQTEKHARKQRAQSGHHANKQVRTEASTHAGNQLRAQDTNKQIFKATSNQTFKHHNK